MYLVVIYLFMCLTRYCFLRYVVRSLMVYFAMSFVSYFFRYVCR